MKKEKILSNKYLLASFFIMLSMFFVSWIIESGIIEALFFFDVNAPDLKGNGISIRNELIQSCFNPIVSVYDMFTLTGPLIPIVTLIGMGGYFNIYDGYLIYYIGRCDYFGSVKKAILRNSLIVALCNFFAYFIVLFILSRFCENGKLTLDSIQSVHHFFDKDLFNNYNLLYFITIGFISVFLVSLIIAILIGGLYTLLKSKLKVSIIIIIYTYIFSLIGKIFNIKLIDITLTIRSFDFFIQPFYELFIPLIIPTIIGLILLFRKDIYEL